MAQTDERPGGSLRPAKQSQQRREDAMAELTEVDYIWKNGEMVPWAECTTHVLSHSLHYGSAVFEGARCYEDPESGKSYVFRLRDHMERLHRSCKIAMIDLPYSVDELCQATVDVIRANKLKKCYIRPLVYRGYGQMGVDPTGAPVDVIIAVWPWDSYLGPDALENGVPVGVSSWRQRSINAIPPSMKSAASYMNSILAKLEAKQHGYVEAIMLNEQGLVCEGTGENPEVIRGLNLDIRPGETIALVGASGGGKSTTCALLPRFYDVDSGSITIDGQDVRSVTQRSLREAIGIVQQEVYLFDGTIAENIAYGNPRATMAQIEQAAEKANIAAFIETLSDGYETQAGERGTRLSGGQKQRIAIARVFLKDPKILILDEATSALDNESEHAVQESLAELSRGRTTIVIAHRLSTIKDADEIATIDAGRVVERGTHEELLARGGTYARYYRMQFEGARA